MECKEFSESSTIDEQGRKVDCSDDAGEELVVSGGGGGTCTVIEWATVRVTIIVSIWCTLVKKCCTAYAAGIYG